MSQHWASCNIHSGIIIELGQFDAESNNSLTFPPESLNDSAS